MREGEFKELLEATRRAYDKSDLKKLEAKLKVSWHYSICATRIVPNRFLIIGFNWGAKNGCLYEPQSQIPNESFFDLKELGSMQRIIPYLKKYLRKCLSYQELAEIGQGNYCFFRSEKSKQIKEKDLDLCKLLFQRFIKIARPSTVLCFSSRLRQHLIKEKLLFNYTESSPIIFIRGKRKVSYAAAKGSMKVGTQSVPFSFLPHPNYPLPKEAREQAWMYCFG